MSLSRELLKAIRENTVRPRTAKARQWFKDLHAEGPLREKTKYRYDQNPFLGNIYAFVYDPKHKKTLPYYDKYPMAVLIEDKGTGFLGLNMHYLPLKYRALLLDFFIDLIDTKEYDELTKMKISYAMLKRSSKNKYIKPTIKHYLYKHIKSKPMKIYPDEWPIALFLPFERFEKASKAKVHRDSMRIINGQ